LTSSLTQLEGLPHACWPEGHVNVHVVPLHAAVALPGMLQDAQVPPQQTWPIPHDVVSFTLVAPLQVDTPVEHDVVPVWQTLPPGLHVWFATHAPHWPA
jgi:hypothetical protein